MEDRVYTVAPGEGTSPKCILLDKEVSAFPGLFSYSRQEGNITIIVKKLLTKAFKCKSQICPKTLNRHFVDNIAQLKKLKGDTNLALQFTCIGHL